ncbi:MAG: hypothetical protein IJ659_07315 [Alloprevotella sp.]|nr:hypothetical protein [Alloprevotella sp.]
MNKNILLPSPVGEGLGVRLFCLLFALFSQPLSAQSLAAFFKKYAAAEGVKINRSEAGSFETFSFYFQEETPRAVLDEAHKDLDALVRKGDFQSADPKKVLDIRGDEDVIRILLPHFKVWLRTSGDFLSDAIIVEDYAASEWDAPSLFVSFVTGRLTPDELRRTFRFDFAAP